jgi:hypothetical protein
MCFTSDRPSPTGGTGAEGEKGGLFVGVEAAPVANWEWHPFHPEGSKGQQGRLRPRGIFPTRRED